MAVVREKEKIKTMKIFALAQYEMIKEAREVLFDYCRTISPAHFVNENTSFGQGGSIRNLLLHNANCYAIWIGKRALGKDISFAQKEDNNSMQDIERLFDLVNGYMQEFIDNRLNETEIHFERNGIPGAVMPFKLYTHVTTHEFHHKGQILSLSRHLGYTPVDTDVVR